MQLQGRILKGISGFYEVEAEGELYTCKARGVFRKTGITPLAGDLVRITPEAAGEEGTVDEVLPRRNALSRPPVANLDELFIVVSVCEPEPNALVIDRLTAIAEYKRIEPVIVVTKSDLGSAERLLQTYRQAGFRTFCIGGDRQDVPQMRELLRGHVSAFTGNTGVGKSTLLNALDPSLSIATAQISQKLGRGRHTTRHVELYRTCGGYVADTPGFSALDIENGEFIHKDELQYCFREFAPYLGACRFSTSCAHVRDKGCRVLEALQDGEIAPSRHASYVALYEEAKQVKDWQLKDWQLKAIPHN